MTEAEALANDGPAHDPWWPETREQFEYRRDREMAREMLARCRRWQVKPTGYGPTIAAAIEAVLAGMTEPRPACNRDRNCTMAGGCPKCQLDGTWSTRNF